MPPFSAWGKAKFDSNVDAQINNRPHADPSTNCMPHGLPRLMIAPYGVQIVQTKGLITLMHAVNHNVRYIHMDQKMPAKVPVTFNGYSVGHWEGDTLVVETKNFNDQTWLTDNGAFHTDALRVVERLRRTADTLEWTATAYDPGVLTEPYTPAKRMAKLTDLEIVESPPCIDRSLANMVDGSHHTNPR